MLLVSLGYAPEEEFNVLHGQRRLFFLDNGHHREADVFLDAIEMCHRLDLREASPDPRSPRWPPPTCCSRSCRW